MKPKLKKCSQCKEDKVIWRNFEGEKYCQYCWKKKAPTKINKRSKNKIKEDQEYSILRKEFLEKHPMCQAKLPGCTHVSTDVHHKSLRGENYLKISTWLSSCRHCHGWIHTHPKDSRELGLLD